MIEKSKMLDDQGKPLTQGLFLEVGYDEKYAVYTLKDYDHTWNDKLYPSLKKLYLQMMDPTEYLFAEKHLVSWNQWQRLLANKLIRKHIDEWREELKMKMKSMGIREMIGLATSENGNFQASKFLAECGWDKRGAGRPSKEDVERAAAIEANIQEQFDNDVARLENYRK